LSISSEPNGIPIRAAPLGDARNVMADDDALPLEPVPQVPDVAALPGNDAAVPTPIPPPSKFVLEPRSPDDALPVAAHGVSAGLSPGEESSVAPIGIPGGGTGEPATMPSGDVTPIPRAGPPNPPTCAKTGALPKSTARIAALNAHRIVISMVPRRRSSVCRGQR